MNSTTTMTQPAGQFGYIYIRCHPSYDVYDVCKIGKASNIPERDSQYATGEFIRGQFEAVFEVPFEEMGKIEIDIQNRFQELNIRKNGGTEFYNKSIITLIQPYLIHLGIEYRELSEKEISDLVRTDRERNRPTQTYTPRHDQSLIIGKAVAHFQENDKGLLIIPCGVGKTLISLWITQEVQSKTILIGVPNKLLLKQWEEVIFKIFGDTPYQIVSGGVDIEDIMDFLQEHHKRCIVITTYSSSHKVYTASQNIGFIFDMKILDEAHHLTTNNMQYEQTTKKYIQMLKISSVKQLSLTATIKQLEGANPDGFVVSNDNAEYFGEIIDRKCLLWAINQKIVCDYVIQTITANEEQLESQLARFRIIEENDKRLFLSAFASLKSISQGHSHHLLIYSNNKNNSEKLVQYIRILLDDNYFDISGLYFSNYHSEMTGKEQKEIINNFEKAKFGIITCVYCLGEGWDFPLLDAVVFSENMSSNIRIVQSALRASRKNKNAPAKITKIILPILNREDWLENSENLDLKKVREVIYQMGLEDETIAQKIKVFQIDIERSGPNPIPKPKSAIDEFGEYDDELTQKLRLKTINRTALGTTYEKARKIISEKSARSKKAYYELCDIDIRLSKEPEVLYKEKFTNWIDYLGIPRVYYDFETCKKKVTEYLTASPEFMRNYMDYAFLCNELCKMDPMFPESDLWVDYYPVKNIGELISFPKRKIKIGKL
jgi:superfamily II DNA or RNA helicase